MSSRNAIFNRIANARRQDDRLPTSPDITASRTYTSTQDINDTFSKRLKDNGVELLMCHAIADIPQCLTKLANGQQICVAPHPILQNLDWTGVGSGDVHFGSWQSCDTLAVSHARLAIADTGSLVLASGGNSPTGLAFLPDTHVVILKRTDLVATLTNAMAMFATWTSDEGRSLPRAINIISGASRTADIAGKIVHGAHGPRQLCVVIYDSA